MAQDTATKLDQILDNFGTAMLITQKAGEVNARPMKLLERDGCFTIMFASDKDSAVSNEIGDGAPVALTLQNDAQFLTMRGRATARDDKERAEKIWTEGLRPWFPDGPGDSSLQLLEFEPEFAEYWDVSGAHRLSFLWEAGKAALEGREVDARSIGEHEKVRLNS